MNKMRFHRIYGMVLRYLFSFLHTFDRISDTFYWPTIDLVLWGLTSAYFSSSTHTGSAFITTVITGVLLWIVVWRGQYEITVGFLTELWDRNLINIFISPLTFTEWLISFIIVGVIKGTASLAFAAILAYFMYHMSIFFYGQYLLPFLLLLFISGWWIGFFVAGIIVRFGTRIQTLAWAVAGLLMPFSGVFYPISILPQWAQKVAIIIPTSYIFEDARQLVNKGTIDTSNLWLSLGLSVVYLFLSIWFLRKSMNKILNKGLVNLD